MKRYCHFLKISRPRGVIILLFSVCLSFNSIKAQADDNLPTNKNGDELKSKIIKILCPPGRFTFGLADRYLGCPKEPAETTVEKTPAPAANVKEPLAAKKPGPKKKKKFKTKEKSIDLKKLSELAPRATPKKSWVVSDQAAMGFFGAPITYTDSKTTDIPMPVYINFHDIGIELVKLTHGSQIEVDRMYAEMLLSDLERFMENDKYQDLKEKMKGMRLITKDELDALGVHTKYMIEDSSINIEMPNEWLKPFVLDFNFGSGSLIPNAVSAPVSGYVNLHASELETSAPKGIRARDPFGLNTDGVLTAYGVSLISGANYYNEDLKRTETAVVIPWDKGAHQIWIGDAKYSNSSTINYPELSGINYYKKAFASNSHNEIDGGLITVKNRSTLQIFKNESMWRTLEIGPGVFHLSDLPLDLGQNVIRIVVKDEVTGETTEKIIDDFLPLYSVPEGNWEHVISYGSHRLSDVDGIKYYGTPVAFAGFMYGITRQINGGLDYYATDKYNRATQEGRLFSKTGNFSISTNESQSERGGTDADGFSVKSQYSMQDVPIKGVKTIALSEQLSGPGYKQDELTTDSDSSVISEINVGFRPVKKFNFNIGYMYTEQSSKIDDSYFLNVGRNFNISRHWALSTTGGESWSTQRGDEVRFMISLVYNETHQEYSLNATAQRTQDREESTATYRDNENFSVVAETSNSIGTNQGPASSLTATKIFQRAVVIGTVSEADKAQSANAEVGTAIAFTNDSFAIVHPIGGSFAIFESLNPRGVEFDVSDASGRTLATGGGLLRSVAIPIGDYSQNILASGFSDPEYYTLESSKNTIYFPAFKTGTSSFLVSDQREIVMGTLVDEKGTLLKQATITVSCSKPDDTLTSTTFTNELGEFQFAVKRNAVCHLEYGDKNSDLLDLTWPVKFKDLGPVPVMKGQ